MGETVYEAVGVAMTGMSEGGGGDERQGNGYGAGEVVRMVSVLCWRVESPP
jgi:hypothetical protein